MPSQHKRHRGRAWIIVLLFVIMAGLGWAVYEKFAGAADVYGASSTQEVARSSEPVTVNVLRAYGDSNTFGYGLPTGEAWPYLVAKRLGVPFGNDTMRAISGASVMDWGNNAYADTIKLGDVSVVLPGYNDLRNNGPEPSRLEAYRLALAAYTAWLALTDDAKLKPAAMTFGPGWNAAAGGTRVAANQGAQASFEVEGSAVYVGGISGEDGGEFIVEIDGKPHAFSAKRTVGNGGAVSKVAEAAALYAVRGLAEGPHKVSVRVVKPGRVGIAWAAGTGGGRVGQAHVFLGNTLRIKAAAIGRAGTSYGNYTPEGQQAYSAAAERVSAELAADGLSVTYVDAASYYDPDRDQTQSDGIHLNFRGRDAVARAFIEAMSPERFPLPPMNLEGL